MLIAVAALLSGLASIRSNSFMKEAYRVVEFVAARDYEDRLVGYNNDSTTTFANVRAFLRVLQNRFVRASAAGASGSIKPD